MPTGTLTKSYVIPEQEAKTMRQEYTVQKHDSPD